MNIIRKIALCCTIFFLLFGSVFAQNSSRINELREQIENRSEAIESLEEEIDQYQEDLFQISQEKQTLESKLREIELSRRKLNADISVIQERINTADLVIEELSLELQEKEDRIDLNKKSLASTLRSLDEMDDQTLVETLLTDGGAREAWAQLDTLSSFQNNLSRNLGQLKELKAQVEENQNAQIEKKKELVNLRTELVDKRELVDQARSEQSQLVEVTENKESEYQALIAQRQAQKERFEQELLEIESQLQIAIDPSKLPDQQTGLFSWPLDDIYVTQNFGRTSDSGRLYASGTHNGTDFRATRGTNVKTVLSGRIQATGDTGYPNSSCLSYGKWVLVDHQNGLTSLYAHLSQIRVESGTQVNTGDVIGYSGNTGYSTGPHLHLSVYASEGVRVGRLGSFNGERSTPCRDAVLPVADKKAYLDPLEYLPSL